MLWSLKLWPNLNPRAHILFSSPYIIDQLEPIYILEPIYYRSTWAHIHSRAHILSTKAIYGFITNPYILDRTITQDGISVHSRKKGLDQAHMISWAAESVSYTTKFVPPTMDELILNLILKTGTMVTCRQIEEHFYRLEMLFNHTVLLLRERRKHTLSNIFLQNTHKFKNSKATNKKKTSNLPRII